MKQLIIFLIVCAGIALSKRVSKSSKKAKSKAKKKQYFGYNVYSYPSTVADTPNYISSSSYDSSVYPYTTLTSGTFSSQGNLYQARPGDAIPYGTGYSYGSWQRIPMRKKSNHK